MATLINNSASATYGYGREGQGSVISNVATTSLIEDFAISGTKTALKTDFRPGENITYQIYIRNDGTEPLYNVTVSDDLGGVNNPLSYIVGSASLNLNGLNSAITPTDLRPLTFVLPGVLNAGSQATITYIARVSSILPTTTDSIVNSSSITANEGSATGALISVDPVPTATITLEDFALLSITKDVSETEIVPGQSFSYTITLENSGNLDANGVVVTDVLPEGFDISSITLLSEGVTTVLDPTDYSVDSATNTLTIPSGSALSISVPAADATGSGSVVITITGSINS